MTLLPEIREQLLEVTFGTAEPRAGAPRRRPRSGSLAIASSILITVVVAAVFLLSLHGSATQPSGAPTGPKGGPPAPAPGAPPAAWVNALGKAGTTTREHDAACRAQPEVPAGNRRFLTSAPPRSITSILPSLASPARGSMRVTVRELRALRIDANGIYARYAWQGRTEGVHYYVVPAAIVGRTTALSPRCYRKGLAAFRRAARRFPASQRAAAVAYAQQQFRRAATPGVAVLTEGWRTGGGSFYQAWRLAQLNKEPAFGSGGGGTNSSTTTTLLVTDEVASVTATYPAQSSPGRVPRRFSVIKRPFHNLVIFHLSGAWDPPRLTFRSTTGAVIARKPNR